MRGAGNVRLRLAVRTMAASTLSAAMLAVMLVSAPPAGAYGKVGGENVWQIGLSFNCNGPNCDPTQLGGFWGWAQFNQNPATGATDGDAEFAGCGHGGGGGGADHTSLDITSWTIEPGSAGPR